MLDAYNLLLVLKCRRWMRKSEETVVFAMIFAVFVCIWGKRDNG